VDEEEMRQNHDELFRYGAYPNPEELGFSRFAPGKPPTRSLESLRVP